MKKLITRRYIRPHLLLSLFMTLTLAFFPAQVQAHAYSDANILPLEDFIQQVINGDEEALRGIYVPGVFASVVTQQPEGEPAFVSPEENTITQFDLASQYGSIGLLAHNYLAGKDFFLLGEGRVFYLIYGDGTIEAFHITNLVRVQALESKNVYSDFINLETDNLLTVSELFYQVYDQPGKVILQTCIEAHGNASWGRLFVIADPYDEKDPTVLPDLEILD